MNSRNIFRFTVKLLVLALAIVLLAEPAVQVDLESNLLSNDYEPVLAVRSKRSLDTLSRKDAKLVDVLGKKSQKHPTVAKARKPVKQVKTQAAKSVPKTKHKSKAMPVNSKKGPAKSASRLVNAKPVNRK